MQGLFRIIGVISIVALSLAAVAETSAQTSTDWQIRFVYDKPLCHAALNSTRSEWNSNSDRSLHVAEAVRRGLTVDACRQLIAQTSSAPTTTRTYWSYNGSIVYLVADGSKREFYFEKPSAEMLAAGATEGSLLFSGKAVKDSYLGRAYVYNSRCGKTSYDTNGPILDNYERVVLQGQAPKIAADCRVSGYSKDTLELTLLKPEDAKATGAASEVAEVGYTFDGKCRGFPEKERVGILAGPEKEMEKVIEGEGYAVCKFLAGSPAGNKIQKECSYGRPCEIDGKFRVNKDHDLDILDVQSAKGWESWEGTCYGSIKHEGDGYFSAGVVDVLVPNRFKRPVRCAFYEEWIATTILAVCPEDSICEIKARFAKQPEVSLSSDQRSFADIGFVDSVQVKEPPTSVGKSGPDTYRSPSPDTSGPLGLCSLAIKDPLRPMVIDTFISGGKHLGGGLTPTLKAGLERDYGSFLEIYNNATVERVDKETGKIGCAVTYEIDLQGLTKRVLDEGATARAQILIKQMAQAGRVMSRRLQYTVQETSGGNYMVWFGLPAQSRPQVRRRTARCVLVSGGWCVAWAR